MISYITQGEFHDGFVMRQDNFSYEARNALFEFYEQLEESMDEQIEFDPIAICCDWTEFEPEEAIEYYGMSDVDELRANTTVLDVEGRTTILVQNY